MRKYTHIEVANYIADNYKFFSSVAKGITKDRNTADDLISIIITQLYHYKKTLEIKNINSYIYTMLRNEYIGKNTEYYRQYRKTFFSDLPETISTIEDDNQTEIAIELSNRIIGYVQNSDEINWFQKKIWLLYYQNEQFKDISSLDLNEVNKIRKMSYRRLQEDLKINYETLCITVNEVNKKLKLKEIFKK